MAILGYHGSPFGPDLYKRLDTNKNSSTTVVNEPKGFKSMVDGLLADQGKGIPISIGIGGGGAFGQASILIARTMLEKGIKPNEYIGNSVGAVISTLFAQGYIDECYTDFFFDGAEKGGLSLSFRLSKFIPFTIKLNEKTRELLIKYSSSFRNYIDQHQDVMSRALTSLKKDPKLIAKFINDFLLEISQPGLSEDEGSPISFNDIKEKHATSLSIQVSVLAAKSGVSHLIQRIKTKNITRGNRDHSHFIRAISFRGSHPVLDALLASSNTNPLGPRDINIQGKSFKMNDGYFAGQNYPHKSIDFKPFIGKDSKKIIIQTDDDFLLTRMVAPDYGDGIDFVIRPDLYMGGALDFSQINREKIRAKAMELLEKVATV